MAPRVVIETNEVAATEAYVAAGLGIAILPSDAGGGVYARKFRFHT